MRIKAEVSSRVLKKAESFFTGSTQGRIIEIMQNCRRSGATQVSIKQHCDVVEGKAQPAEVTIEDNGSGVYDWSKLLHLGETGWSRDIEESEDPAGVGLFSLAPRSVTIQSMGKAVCIEGDAWYGGSEIDVRYDISTDAIREGTRLRFVDDSWGGVDGYHIRDTKADVQVPHREIIKAGAFGSMKIQFNSQQLPSAPFLLSKFPFRHITELGVKIQVIPNNAIFESGCYHNSKRTVNHPVHYGVWGGSIPEIVLNFHGQLIPISVSSYKDEFRVELPCEGMWNYGCKKNSTILVDMTGEETPIRLMLPARTRLVENEAAHKLVEEIQRSILADIARRKHNLTFDWYQRALALGVDIKEATPSFSYGTDPPDDRGMTSYPGSMRRTGDCITKDNHCISPECEVVFHDDHGDSIMYSYDIDDPECRGDFDGDDFIKIVGETIHDNADGFSIVNIPPCYEGYSWAKTDAISFIEINAEKWTDSWGVWGGTVHLYDRIQARIGFDSGDVKTVDIPVAIIGDSDGYSTDLAVTEDALDNEQSLIMYCLGGYSEDEDRSEQDKQFDEEIKFIQDELIGPKEGMRRALYETIYEHVRCLPATVRAYRSGAIKITNEDGCVEITTNGAIRKGLWDDEPEGV